MPSLELIGNIGLEVSIHFTRVHTKTKLGRRKTVLLGHSEGTRKYKLVYRTLSDRGTGTTAFDKVWNFYQARRADGQPFDVEDVLLGSTLSMRFADKQLTAEQFKDKLYSIDGVALVQDRAATLTVL